MKRAFLIFCFAIFCVFGAVSARSILQDDEEERGLLLAVRKPVATIDEENVVNIEFQTGPSLGIFDYAVFCVEEFAGCRADPVTNVESGELTREVSTIEATLTGLTGSSTTYDCYISVSTDKVEKCELIRVVTSDAPPPPPDGWTSRQTPNSYSWDSVAWGGPEGAELFVAVAPNAPGASKIMTSPDGISWTVPAGLNFQDSLRLRDITWGSPQSRVPTSGVAKFVAVASSSPATVAKSLDGINWVYDDTTVPSNEWRGVTYSPELGLYVAVAWDDSGSQVMTSPNGDQWTAVPGVANTGYDWTSVAWSPSLGLFAAVASSGGVSARVMTSPDGASWSPVVSNPCTGNSWRSIVWGGPAGEEKFVAVASSGDEPRVMTSTDGATWEFGTNVPEGSWQSVSWGGPAGSELFVVVGGSVMTSPDGVTWTIAPLGSIPDGGWMSVAYGGPAGSELFAAVADEADDGLYVMTSYTGIGIVPV